MVRKCHVSFYNIMIMVGVTRWCGQFSDQMQNWCYLCTCTLCCTNRHAHYAARLVVRVSLLRVRWNRTRFHAHSWTLLGVPTASDWLWKYIFLRRKGAISALEALRDALYKSTTTAIMEITKLWFNACVKTLISTFKVSYNNYDYNKTLSFDSCVTIITVWTPVVLAIINII